MCLAQGHNAVTLVRLELATLDLKLSTLPLSHCAPFIWIQIRPDVLSDLIWVQTVCIIGYDTTGIVNPFQTNGTLGKVCYS